MNFEKTHPSDFTLQAFLEEETLLWWPTGEVCVEFIYQFFECIYIYIYDVY